MDKFIQKLWDNNRILFFILLPLIALYFFRDLIINLLVGSSRRISQKTKAKDEELKDEVNKIINESERLENKANELNPTEVDEDWHKKR